ncbi:MAG: hypothetical protein R3C18_23190 [Planctomycetaceae bacterium]
MKTQYTSTSAIILSIVAFAGTVHAGSGDVPHVAGPYADGALCVSQFNGHIQLTWSTNAGTTTFEGTYGVQPRATTVSCNHQHHVFCGIWEFTSTDKLVTKVGEGVLYPSCANPDWIVVETSEFANGTWKPQAKGDFERVRANNVLPATPAPQNAPVQPPTTPSNLSIDSLLDDAGL